MSKAKKARRSRKNVGLPMAHFLLTPSVHFLLFPMSGENQKRHTSREFPFFAASIRDKDHAKSKLKHECKSGQENFESGARKTSKAARKASKAAGTRSQGRSKNTSDIGAAPERTGGGTPETAEELLKADHRRVEELFTRYEESGESADKQELARQVCMELMIHTRARGVPLLSSVLRKERGCVGPG